MPVSEYLCSHTFQYDINNNALLFNEEKLSKENDGKKTMMKALLQIISNRIDEKTDILAAFNQGVDEIIATNLVG